MIDPSYASKNPFRIDDKPGADTRCVVRSVLSFLEQTFLLMDQVEEVPWKNSMEGAALIVNACTLALMDADKEPDDDLSDATARRRVKR